MSGSASIGLEQAILGHTLGFSTLPATTTAFVALCALAPPPTEVTGGAEASGGSYSRVPATFALVDAPANLAANVASVEWPVATASWGTMGYFELWDSASGGNRLYWGQLLDPVAGTPVTVTVVVGDIVRFSAGALAVQAATGTGETIGTGAYLPLAGGVMQGPITLAADPTLPLVAATKQYVDNNRSAAFGPVTSTGSTTPRQLQDRFAAAYDIRDFGARCDGTTDDSGALNAAIARLTALPNGGKIILPAARTVIASAVTATISAGANITIEGMGTAASELYFSAATDGLAFTLANSGTSWGGVHLRGFTLTRGPTSPAIANTGLSISVPSGAPMYGGTSSLRDLRVYGSASAAGTNQWRNSVVLAGISGISVDNVTITGINSTATDTGDALLSIQGGPAANQFGATHNIINCNLVGGSVGINVSQFVQGVFVANSTIIGQYDSIRWTGGGAYSAEEIAVTNCTLNAGHRGFYTSGVNQCAISNTTILRFGTGVTVGFAGVEINQGAYCSVIGNNIIGGHTGTENAIIMSACSTGNNTVIGNISTNIAGGAIWLSGNTVATTVVGNNMVSGGGSAVSQDTLGNTILGNTWNNVPVDFTQAASGGGGVILKGSGGQTLTMNVPSGTNTLAYEVAGNGRWYIGTDGTAATGGNTGDNLEIVRVDDGGSPIFAALTIMRPTGNLVLGAIPTNAANDAAAASAGILVGGVYRNGSILQVRVT